MTSEVSVKVRPAPDTSTTGKHIAALDGLRGVAILLVLMLHLLWANNHPDGGRIVQFFASFISCGSLGVDLFFALSGFLITGILYDTRLSTHFFRNFYARRTLRVFPLYYGFIALLVILSYALGSHWHRGIIGLLTYGIIVPHAIIWDAWWINLSHFWSLAIEEQFYLCWPVFVYALRTKRRILSVAVLLALASFGLRCFINLSGAAHHDAYLAYSWTPARLDGLLFGSALALVTRSSRRDSVLRLSPIVLCGGICALAAYGFLHGGLHEVGDPWMQTFGILIASLTSCAAIASSLRPGSLVARSMQASWLRFFGRYSYGLYVMHYTIATALLPARPAIAAATHSKLMGVLGAAALSLGASILAAMLSYRFFEQPILTLKRHFQDDSATPKLRRQLSNPSPSDLPAA